MTAVLVLALFLWIPASAMAADRCLSGASVLGDQRGLASVRANLDSTCACATYDGSPGLDRPAYGRCARDVVRAAVDAATLRRECRSRASKLYRTAVCGTERVACGAFRAAAGRPVSCATKPAEACVDRSGVERNICAAQDFCGDVIDWTAGTCIDPRQRRSPVGVRIFSRVKQSVVDPMQPRQLDTVVWYPTAAAGAEDPPYAAILDAPLDGAGAPYPLLLYSHGACGRPTSATFLLPLIASYGYVVAAVPHPGNMLGDPDCLSDTALFNSANERPYDVGFVLDELLAANADAPSPFFGSVDPDRIGMSGHSFGGWTTFYVTGADPRFKVALLMASGIPAAVTSVSVPSLHMLGEIDSVSIGGTTNAERTDAFLGSAPPKFLVSIANAGHFAFSDGCFPGPDCAPPATLTQAEAHAVVLRWALPFLERYLRGDLAYDAFFAAPAPAGVDFAAQP